MLCIQSYFWLSLFLPSFTDGATMQRGSSPPAFEEWLSTESLGGARLDWVRGDSGSGKCVYNVYVLGLGGADWGPWIKYAALKRLL